MFRLFISRLYNPTRNSIGVFLWCWRSQRQSCRLNQPNDVEQQTWGREKGRRAGVRKRLPAVRFGQEWSLSIWS